VGGLVSYHRRRSELHGALFGREREQAVIGNALDDLFSGHGGLLLIAGEPGIGKTSLVRLMSDEAASRGAKVLTSACYDLMVTPPYGPWIELFSRFGDSIPLPSLPGDSQHGDAHRVPSQDALFANAFESLTVAASEGPLILVLEDMHWADAASLEFLRYVARQIGDIPILLIATYRDTDLDRRHPLNSMLPILVRESGATRINLRPLDVSAVTDLVGDHYDLSPTDESRVVQYLLERAEGNPFFIEETLRTLEEEGIFTETDRGWQVGDLSRVLIPPLVQQVIEGRLARLDPKTRNLLEIASVIGQDVPLDIWQAASGASQDDLTSAIRDAIDLHVLEETAEPIPLRFSHALVREALYFDLGLPQRRALHQAVGEALATRPSPNADAVAHHFLEAKTDQATSWLLAAGERAQQLYAWRSAAECFESVLPFLESNPDYVEVRGWLLYRIGLLLIYADPQRGIVHLREAERVAHTIDDQHLVAYASADRGLLRCLTGDARRGLDEMRAGVAALDDLPAIEVPALSSTGNAPSAELSVEGIQRGAFDLIGTSNEMNIRKGALVFWLAWSGRYDDAVSIGEPYTKQAKAASAGMEDSLGDALAGLGHAYAALGRPDEAFQVFAQARDTYQKIDHHFKVGNTAIYELSEALLPYRADRIMERQWLADQAEAL
jgi:tetratricopeptide (TPR) repeat protein